jgi:guanosine-3',5'-bis(diphosphate) 3'-pyrophosphohydrolase
MNIIEKSRMLAHVAHDSIKQIRKYTGEPYHVHTDEVSNLVASVRHEMNINEAVIAAGNTHDIIEDVFPIHPIFDTYLIAFLLGDEVARLTTELTDRYTKEAWPDLTRAQRKKAERERISKISNKAKTVKIADVISNTASIVEYDPDFAKTYLVEKYYLLQVLEGGSPTLMRRAQKQCIEGLNKLGIKV